MIIIGAAEAIIKIAKEKHISAQLVMQNFMLERLLERISVSKYKDNFILKGGLLLSALFGIDNRTTRDMDTTIKGLNISKEKMINVLNEILNINLKDGVKFELIDITDIRFNKEYFNKNADYFLNDLMLSLKENYKGFIYKPPIDMEILLYMMQDNEVISVDKYLHDNNMNKDYNRLLRKANMAHEGYNAIMLMKKSEEYFKNSNDIIEVIMVKHNIGTESIIFLDRRCVQ